MLGREPRRLPVHVRPRRLWRKNLRDNNGDGRSRRRRRRPEPQLPRALGLRQRGLLAAADERHLPRPVAGLRARDAGPPGLLRPRALRRSSSTTTRTGPLILYPSAGRSHAERRTTRIFEALGGTDRQRRRVPGFDPGLRAELYITNGETTDYAHARDGTLRLHASSSTRARPGARVRVPRRRGARAGGVPEEPAASPSTSPSRRATPATPDSPPRQTSTTPFYLAPVHGLLRRPAAGRRSTPSAASASVTLQLPGQRRPRADARRRPSGTAASATAAPASLPHRCAARSPGRAPATTSASGSPPRRGTTAAIRSPTAPRSSRPARVLVVSAEDYTGISPVSRRPDGPQYLHLLPGRAGRQRHRRRRLRRRRPRPHGAGPARRPPHYDAVVWYTGDDIITREPGMVPRHGVAARRWTRCCRSATTSTRAAGCSTPASTRGYAVLERATQYDPAANAPCDPALGRATAAALLHRTTSCSTGSARASTTTTRAQRPTDAVRRDRVDTPFDRRSRGRFGGAERAATRTTAPRSSPRAGSLPGDSYPQFRAGRPRTTTGRAARSRRTPATHYVYSQIARPGLQAADAAPSTCRRASGSLSFWTSYDTEQDWDYLFVEAHTVGQDDWTTLPDQNGHTTTDTGQSCAAGWDDIHPFARPLPDVRRRAPATLHADGHDRLLERRDRRLAAAGSSGRRPVAPTPGSRSRCRSPTSSDWGTQGLGVFLDDVVALDGRVDLVRGRPRRLGRRRGRPGQRRQPEQLVVTAARVPGGRGRRHAADALPGLRVRGSRRRRGAGGHPRQRPGLPAHARLMAAGGVAPRGATPPYCRPCSTSFPSSGGRPTATTRRISRRC